MCGIAGVISLSNTKISGLSKQLEVMNKIQEHRGPDGKGIWIHQNQNIGFAHQRLSIIDLNSGQQPMIDSSNNCLVFNGEIYNYLELRKGDLGGIYKTNSDTEVLLKSYQKWGKECIQKFRGMFSFALWDEKNKSLFCARDRFGIKPFYYTLVEDKFYFSSEAKTLLPFIKEIETDLTAFKEYLTFQFCLGEKTLFKGIYELPPGHMLTIVNGEIKIIRYWEVYYNLDFYHTSKYFEEKIRHLLSESVKLHVRSDVPIGVYISGGIDSSVVASISRREINNEIYGFVGKFSGNGLEFDESHYASEVASKLGIELYQLDINAHDFIDNIEKVIYHLDMPVAGPGAFAQYMISSLVSKYRKVILGGQGGDEIFGGYTRYLIAYFEQCIKAAIDGTMHNGNFIVTYESIIPNLESLRNYKPLLKEFWKDGLFEDLDNRYYRLINRAPSLGNEINWGMLEDYSVYDSFSKIFNSNNVGKESYFDKMTHFDFKTLLPALLHVEDRMSMAHGLESRIPLLDHPLVEMVATIPSNIKFENGEMKKIFKSAIKDYLPKNILNRKDKMGFPVPFNQWMKGPARDFIFDTLSSRKALTRDLVNNRLVLNEIDKEGIFGRKLWGLLSLEIWQRKFHDEQTNYKKLLH